MTQIVEFKVVVTSTCTPQWANIPLQGLDRCVPTMGATSSPHCQIRAIHWHHLTSCEFTWSAKGTLEKQTS